MSPLEIEREVYNLRNAIKVLSCVIGYSTEHPDGPPQRSDHNLDVSKYQIDALVLLTAVDRCAELADALYEKVTRPAVT